MADTNEQAQALRAAVVEHFTEALDGVAEDTESPIEELLYWALLCTSPWILPAVHWGAKAASWFRLASPAGRIFVYPQYTLEAAGSKYRLDFFLESRGLKFALECDGHDFHERTKEQAARDRKRDRDLQAAGLTVLRFTGSEINRDPVAVAREVIRAVETQVTRHFGGEEEGE